jgi:hypothetical protein
MGTNEKEWIKKMNKRLIIHNHRSIEFAPSWLNFSACSCAAIVLWVKLMDWKVKHNLFIMMYIYLCACLFIYNTTE